jgi:hypothetical protein
MEETKTTISEDRGYKPSSPDKPGRRFFVETDTYRWEVYVSRYEIKETGTPVYCAVTPEGHSAYGMTANETVNDIAGIMLQRLAGRHVKKVPFEDVRDYLDPMSAALEEIRASEIYSRKPLLFKILGI